MQLTHEQAVEAGQESVFEVALELARLDRRLARVGASLPLAADVEDQFEDRLPSTSATQLFSVIGAVKEELQMAVRVLLEVAQVNDVVLRQEFRRQEAPR